MQGLGNVSGSHGAGPGDFGSSSGTPENKQNKGKHTKIRKKKNK